MNYTIVINGFVWAGCMVYYFLFARRWYTGPQMTADESASTASDSMMVDPALRRIPNNEPASLGRKQE
jgi:hypothetical protein